MKGDIKIFFKKEQKQDFLGRFTLSNMAENLEMSKSNLSKILNGKLSTSKANAYYMTSISNKVNGKAYEVNYYFEKIAN